MKVLWFLTGSLATHTCCFNTTWGVEGGGGELERVVRCVSKATTNDFVVVIDSRSSDPTYLVLHDSKGSDPGVNATVCKQEPNRKRSQWFNPTEENRRPIACCLAFDCQLRSEGRHKRCPSFGHIATQPCWTPDLHQREVGNRSLCSVVAFRNPDRFAFALIRAQQNSRPCQSRSIARGKG